LTCSAWAASANQNCVDRVDDQQVAGAQSHDWPMRGVNKRVGGLNQVTLAMDAVALGIGRRKVGHSVPAADIAPGGGKRQHGNVVSFFQNGVVNALGAAGGKGFLAQAAKVTICRLGGNRGLACGQNVRRVGLERSQQGAGPDQKNASVPEVAASQQQLLRTGGIGFFDKALHCVGCALPCQRDTLLNVAVGSAGKRRLYTKGDDGASLRRRDA
jgi:hypothetical protein